MNIPREGLFSSMRNTEFKPEDIPASMRQYFTEVERKCGTPWERVMEKVNSKEYRYQKIGIPGECDQKGRRDEPCGESQFRAIGWRPGCECGFPDTVPAVVLDPFAGSGTTGAVALELGRHAVLVELNPAYVAMIRQRCAITPGLQLA